MPRHFRARLRAIALTGVACLLGSAAASAGYSEKPPKGVVLAGTRWQLDPYRSDDPALALKQARDQIASRRRKVENVAGARPPGGQGGQPIGGKGPGGDPAGAEGAGGEAGRGPPGERRGGPPGGGILDDLVKNPVKLVMAGTGGTLRIDADEFGSECEVGNDTMLEDRFGYGVRTCGWDGRAWVVETRHDRGPTRIDRYELAKDGRVLNYSTSITGKGIPKVQITRTYEPAAAAAPVPGPAPAAASR
jgi:hypothetical protein